MIYECSNHHRFEAPQPPFRCAASGCESRVLRQSDQRVAPTKHHADRSSDLLGNLFRFTSLLTLGLLPIIAVLVSGETADDASQEPSLAVWMTVRLLSVFALASFVTALVTFLMGLHRSWHMVEAIRNRSAVQLAVPSPGMAIGLLFVPFFDLYWAFCAWNGLPRALTALAQAHHFEARKLSQLLALLPCILNVLVMAVLLIPFDEESSVLSLIKVLVVVGWALSVVLFGHEMFAVTRDLRRKLEA